MFTFREIETKDAQMILDWRTSPRVAKYMKTDVEHGVEEQQQWIISCRERANFYHWLIVYQNQPIGYISLSEYNPVTKTGSWGCYVGEEEHAGLGGLVPPFFYRFCFTDLNIERIDAEMLYFNTGVIDLHRLHGYEFTPERDRILKRKGKGILLVTMSLRKFPFEEGKFARFKATFPMLQWRAKNEAVDTGKISLVKIEGTDEQISILYQLLTKREYSISHEELPTLEKHDQFVKSHPYRAWWLVECLGLTIGSVYLTNENAIGVNLSGQNSEIYCQVIQVVKEQNDPLRPIPSVRPAYFFVNAAPENAPLQHALLDMGAKQTQNSYRV